MLIQIHLLQNYAPANLNRDDTGSPKDAVFGGVRRGRISSQCLKRSIRKSQVFSESFAERGLLASRTRLLPELIAEELNVIQAESAITEAIVARIPEFGRESGKNKATDDDGAGEAESAESAATKQLIFIDRNELRPMAEKLLAIYQEEGKARWSKLKINEITRKLGASTPRSVDVAMFGRMTTSEAFENVQAAVQVAHALSTHTLAQEFDYFTAVDDISGESGAGMIGDVEFNSSTYYRYINIHWEQLVANLGDDRALAAEAVLALIEAAATAQPGGKQNSFAAHNLPDLILIEISRRNLPVSYANAFLNPVRKPGNGSIMAESIERLGEYMDKIQATYQIAGERAFAATNSYELPSAERLPSLPGLLEWVAAQIGDRS